MEMDLKVTFTLNRKKPGHSVIIDFLTTSDNEVLEQFGLDEFVDPKGRVIQALIILLSQNQQDNEILTPVKKNVSKRKSKKKTKPPPPLREVEANGVGFLGEDI